MIAIPIFFVKTASSQILSDSLKNSTVGTMIGGEFVPSGGWKSITWDNIIIYDLHNYILKGRLEIDITNFDPSIQSSLIRHHILSMYSDALGDHNDPSMNGPDLSEGSVWNLHTGTNYEGGGFKLLSIAGDKIQNYVYNLNWSTDSTYHFVISWDENKVELFVDNVLLVGNENIRDFALRYLFIGRDFTRALDIVTGFPNNEYTAHIGPVYSNVLVFADSLVPEPRDSALVEIAYSLPEQNDILSFDMTLDYDPELLNFHSIETDSSGTPLNILFNSNPGELILGTFSTSPITIFDNIVTARFTPVVDSNNVRIAYLDLERFLVNAVEQPWQSANYIFRPENFFATPVELSLFEVKIINENSVVLYWETASESDNFGFEIQRSNGNMDFRKIGFVKGNATSTIHNSYQFTDNQLESGKYWYRLKQIDFSGTFKYSDIQELFIQTPIDFILYENYPNPFRDKTKISFLFPPRFNSKPLQINIYDIRGRVVRTVNTTLSAGNYYELIWDGKDYLNQALSNGIYFFTVEIEGFKTSQKILIVR